MRRSLIRLIPLLLIAATLVTFWPALHGEFLLWDDAYNLVDNPHIRDFSWPNVRWMFTTFHNAIYEPLSWAAKGVQYQLWGLRPRAFHAYSLLLHVINTLLVYALTVRLLRLARRGSRGQAASDGAEVVGRNPGLYWGAAAAALLFALHPLRTECVALISVQPHLQAAALCLLAIWAYVRWTGRKRRRSLGFPWLALALFALSLLSKPVALGLPLVLLLLDVYPLRRWRPRWRLWLVVEKLPFVALSIVMAYTASLARQEQVDAALLADFGAGPRIAQAAYCATFHLYKSIVPTDLKPIYVMLEEFDPRSARFVGCTCFVALVSVVAVLLRARLPALLAGWLFYLIMLSPFLGLTTRPHYPVDRYTYLPLLGVTTLVGAALASLWPRYRRRIARAKPSSAALAGLLLVACALGVMARQQTRIWNNSVVLLEHVVRLLGDSPRRAEMLWRLGTALDLEQRYDEAAMRFREALQHDPQFANAHVGLALACAHQGRWAEAVAANEQALRLLPDDWQTNFNLAAALVSLGEMDRGVAQFRRTIALDPSAYTPYVALSTALSSRGRCAEALDVLSEGLRHTGGNWSVAARIIWLLAACPDESLRNGAQAVMLAERLNDKSAGRDPAVLDALAAAYAEAERFEDAVATARRAVEQANVQGAEELAAEIRRRLALYESGRPYREPGEVP